MFLHGDDYECVEARRGNHLANILDVPNQGALERDLRQIHRMLSSGLPIAPEPTHVVGETVRIRVGPLQGLVGTVVRRGGRDRFVATVRFLGRGVTVELQDWQVETVETRPLASSDHRFPSRTDRCACSAL
jgi:transcriptional antiterminator RfaH